MVADVVCRRLTYSRLLLDCWYPASFSGCGSVPVIIFEHGYQANARQSGLQMHYLAEKGYVLLAMNHTNESLFNIKRRLSGFSAGKSTLNTFNPSQALLRRAETRKVYKRFRHSQNRDDALAAMKEFSVLKYLDVAHQAISQRMEKVLQLLDSLKELNMMSFFGGLMDLERVGIYGHSMGGNVSCLVAASKDLPVNLKAAANLDGVQLIRSGEELPQVDIPFMMVYGTAIMMGNLMMNLEGANDWLFEGKEGWRVVFPGVRHKNFSNLGGWGFLFGRKMVTTLNALLLHWFDKNLKHKAIKAAELEKLYPHWRISSFSAP